MSLKYEAPVDGNIDGQPLYVRDVSFPSGRRNALFVVTENNTVYAFDADTGAQKWVHSLADSFPLIRSLPRGSTNPPSTPVIDARSQTMYVLFSTKNQLWDTAGTITGEVDLETTLSVAYWLVALDIRTGNELRRTWVEASATRTDGTTAMFDPRRQVNHPALLLDHGSIYMAYGSRWQEGVAEYHGWVMRYDARTFQRKGVFCTTVEGRGPSEEGAGIWQGGGGLAADSDGYIYFLTGNGPASPTHHSYGDSFVKLKPSGDNLVVAGSVAPPEAVVMDRKDLDLGSGGLIVIPGTNLLVGGGKTGMIYVVDSGSMTILQSLQAFSNTYHPDWNYGCPATWTNPPCCSLPNPTPNCLADCCANWSCGPHLHGSPTYWNGHLYHWSEKDHLKEFTLNKTTRQFSLTGMGSVLATATLMPGGITSLSSNGNTSGSAIVWAILPDRDRSHIFAFNADQTLQLQTLQLLWNAPFPALYPWMSKHAAPTIADGKLVVASASSRLLVYELGPLRISGGGATELAPWTQPYQPTDPPGPPFAIRFEGERNIGALPAFLRTQLAPPADQIVLFAVTARLDGSIERFAGGSRRGFTWQSDDGSKVTAREIKSVPAPYPKEPPWKLFEVVSHEGKGRLSGVAWIQRVDTDGNGATYKFFGSKP